MSARTAPRDAPLATSGAEASSPFIRLLDGGLEAYPPMLAAIEAARERIHLEVYAFSGEGVGARFLTALEAAARRGVQVKVIVDGWGSWADGRAISRALRRAGAKARVFNPLTSICFGRSWRNHRKILLVDDAVAFLGGINIGDAYATEGARRGWADLALELRGPVCADLGRALQRGGSLVSRGEARIFLSGFGGGRRLREQYLRAIKGAKRELTLAHAYFIPHAGLVRALRRAARRGVSVTLLLAGRSDVPFARAASMRLYRTFLQAGVHIYEWSQSTFHAKAATVDGERLLVGSFNLDPLSLVNLETLVEVSDRAVVAQGDAWLGRHLDGAHRITLEDCGRSRLQRWLLDVLGLLVARVAEATASFLGSRRLRRL